MQAPLNPQNFGSPAFQTHLEQLKEVKDSLRSLEGITLRTAFDEAKIKFIHVPNRKGIGQLLPALVQSAKKMWKEDWRAQLEHLQMIQTICHSALTAVRKDAADQNITQNELKILSSEIRNLGSLLNKAGSHLERLKTEFQESQPKEGLTPRKSVLKFEAGIDAFIQQAKEDISHAQKALEGGLVKFPTSRPRGSPAPAPPAALPTSESLQAPKPAAVQTTAKGGVRSMRPEREKESDQDKKTQLIQEYLLSQMELEVDRGDYFGMYNLNQLREELESPDVAEMKEHDLEDKMRALEALERREQAIEYRGWETRGRREPPSELVKAFMARHINKAGEFAEAKLAK